MVAAVRVVGLILSFSVCACGTAADAADPTTEPAPVAPAPVAPGPVAPEPVAPTEPPQPEPGMITDEACLAKGGQIVTEETYAHLDRRDPDAPRTPFRVCRVPPQENGKACTDDSQCGGGDCRCAGALGRPDPRNDPKLVPLDGTEGVGVCSDAPLPSGSWFCLVIDGKVTLNGVIVD